MSARITRARHVSPAPSAFSYHARITFSSPPATKSTSPSPSRSAGHSVVNTLSNVRSSPGSVAVAATLLTHVPVAPPAPTRWTVTSGSDPTIISGCPSPSRSAAWTDHASFAVRAFTTAWPAKLMLPPAPVYRSFSNHRNLFWFVETTRMSLSPSLFTSAARTPRAPSRSSTSTCLWKMISGKLGSHTLNCPATRAARQASAARAALTIIAARAA